MSKKILVLEDDPTRIEWLQDNFADCTINWKTTVNEFVLAYTFYNHDLVIFDHDLTPTHLTPEFNPANGLWTIPAAPNNFSRFDYDKDDLNGLDAARMLPDANLNNQQEQVFLVWSQNTDGAANIVKALRKNNYKNIVVKPFGFYTNDRLKTILEVLLYE